jgi:site-specific recombinase
MNNLKEEIYFGNTIEEHVEALAKLVEFIRPARISKYEEAKTKIIFLTDYLKKETTFRNQFCKAIINLINNIDFTRSFSETGIPTDNDLVSGITTRIKHKILPPLEDESGLIYIIHKIFSKKTDYKWIDKIDEEVWINLFIQTDLLECTINNALQNQLLKAITLISYKIAYLGSDKDININTDKEGELVSAFTEQNKEIILLAEKIKNKENPEDSFRHIVVLIHQCEDEIKGIIRTSKKKGTSIYQSYLIKQLNSLCKRLLSLLSILNTEDLFDEKRFTLFFKHLIREENNRNSIFYFISNSMNLLSNQIVEHESKTGEHYITHNRTDYWSFFYAACYGGFIVSFLVLLKMIIHNNHFHIFYEAILFSLNYAAGFVIIYLAGATLATKQPAMTASAIASTIANDQTYGKRFYFDLSVLIGKVWRSQMISFTGNIIIVFPFTLTLGIIINMATGYKLTEPAQALKMLEDIHPLKSFCLFYAALTGIYLFLSGIFSGYIDNKIIYSQIAERINKHPLLIKLFSQRTITFLSSFTEKNGGALAGNILLGFMLGTSIFIGETFALPIDIRHITFSAGNFALAAYGIGFKLSTSTWIFCSLGIIGIGFMNFLVSFSLAFYVAIKSKNVSLAEYPELLISLFKYLRKFPGDFFYAPKTERELVQMNDKSAKNKV